MKQILLINDVVGYGKVGMGAMLPILSYLGIPTYSLPTALVSNTLDYGKFNIQDTTDYIRGTLPVWKELGFSFDAVCTGLMFSEEQAKLVAGYCREQGAQGTTVFVDPILGDGGRLYNGMTERQVELAREMGLPEKGVAMAVSNRMVPRVEWSTTSISGGEDIVIIKAVCGG